MGNRINILEILETSPSIILLRAKKCDIILEFFSSVFDTNSVISYENIRTQLVDFLNNREVVIDEESDIQISDTLEERAEKYIKKWNQGKNIYRKPKIF